MAGLSYLPSEVVALFFIDSAVFEVVGSGFWLAALLHRAGFKAFIFLKKALKDIWPVRS